MNEVPTGQRLPFPGLRSFRRDETDLFFGRESSVNHMLRRLAASRFLAVLGASGSGKSSLVRTGLLDGLELGLLAQAGTWWRVIDIRPGGEPLRNLARGLCGDDADEADVEQMRAFLLRGPRSIVQWASTNLAKGENLLLLVDQFEELFRYQHYEGRQEAESFVALLIESARNREQSVYVTLTMRSEFLGACALFGGLAEAMNDGQYLTPRMTREQCREAIEGPAAVCGFRIEPALVNRLLNDLSDFAPWEDRQDQGVNSQLDRMVRRADQLPLLQHALNRLWIKAASGGGDVVLKLADYDALGGLRGALNQHAQEILDELGAARGPVVEKVFRALTVGTNIADAVRRPTRLEDLVQITGAPREDVVAVVDAFRAPGRNFLAPFPPTPLRDDTFVDISHESLIRQWTDLSGWLEKEARDADLVRKLGRSAKSAEEQTGDLLRGRELAILESWRSEAKLTQSWASRYVDKPDVAFAFLDQSIQARKDYEQSTAAAKLQAQRSARVRWAAIAGLALLVAGFGGYSFMQTARNQELALANEETAKQAELAQAAAKLAQEQKTKAEAAAADAEREKTRAEASAEEARKAQLELDAQKKQIEQTIQSYVAGDIDKQQRAGDLTSSTDLLAALARQIPTDKLPTQIVDRLAWQSAAQSAVAQPDRLRRIEALANPLKPANLSEDMPAFALWRGKDNEEQTVYVVDQRSGSTVDRFDISDDESDKLKESGQYFIAPDGKAALLVGEKGRLFRWEAGKTDARRVLDRRWLEQSNAAQNRSVLSAAFDTSTGDIAVVFTQYGFDHLTTIPLQDADRAPVWPLVRLAEGRYDPTARWSAAVVAMAAGKPLLALTPVESDDPFADEETTARGKLLLRVDMATGKSTALAGQARLLGAHGLPVPGKVRLELAATPEECNAKIQLFRMGDTKTGAACVVDYDLSSETLVGEAKFVPDQPTRLFRGEVVAGPVRLEGIGQPSWVLDAAAPAATRPDVTRATYWRRKSSFLSNEQTLTKVTTADGFKVIGVARDQIIAEGTLGSAATGVPGAFVEPQTTPVKGTAPDAKLVVADGTGKRVAAFARDKLYFHDGGEKWNEIPLGGVGLRGDKTCLDRIRNTASRPGAPGVSGAGASGTGATDDSDARAEDVLGYSVTAVSAKRPVFLLQLSKESSVAKLQFQKQPDGSYVALVTCPGEAELASNQILALDIERGRVAVHHSTTGLIAVLDLTNMKYSHVGGLNNEFPRSAAFAGNRLVVLTDSGRVVSSNDVGSGTPALGYQDLPNPLPGASAIYATAQNLALVRPEALQLASGKSAQWLSVAVIGFDPVANRRNATIYAGALPVRPDDLQIAQLRAGGQMDVMTADHVFRFELPAVAPAGDLIAALEPLTDESALDAADRSLLGLLASAMSMGEAKREKAYTDAIGLCAESLYRWHDTLADAEYQDSDVADGGEGSDPIVRNECSTLDWPTPEAALALRNESNVSNSWPESASILVAQAAAGDSFALRSLLSWANRDDSKKVRGRGAETALDGLYPSIGKLWSVAPTSAGTYFDTAVTSADPYAHLVAARLAEARGTNADFQKALLHYMVAERLLLDAGSRNLSTAVTARKIAMATHLDAAERAKATAEFRAWRPALPPVADYRKQADIKATIRTDLDHLATLSKATGNAVGFDFLRLHLLLDLNDILELLGEKADQQAVLAELRDVLLSRTEWPEIDVSDDNELVDAHERVANSLTDEATALKVRLAGLRLLENAGEELSLSDRDAKQAGAVYQRLLKQVVAAGKDKVVAAAGAFRFGKRALNFANTRAQEPVQADWIYAILGDRLALAEYLSPRPDAVAAHAATLLWRAENRAMIATSSQLQVSDAEKEKRKAELPAAYRQAYLALSKLPTSGPDMSPDDLALFVSSVRATVSTYLEYTTDAEPMPREFDQARQVADQLFAETERGAWEANWNRPPGDTRMALDDGMAGKMQIGPQDERPFGGMDFNAYRQRMRVIELAASRSRAMLRGGVDAADDREIADRSSSSAAYAVAFVAGREAVHYGTTECDTLASHEGDPKRRAPGRRYDRENALAAAIESCRKVGAEDSSDETSRYLYARTLSDTKEAALMNRRTDMLIALARSDDYAIAFNNLAARASELKLAPRLRQPLSEAYVNRVFRDHFMPAYKGLMGLPEDVRSQHGLRWMSEFAAERGSIDANIVLSQQTSDPVEKAYRLLSVVSLPSVSGDMATSIQADADTVMQGLSEAEKDLVRARVAAYRPADLFKDAIPPETEKALRDGIVQDN